MCKIPSRLSVRESNPRKNLAPGNKPVHSGMGETLCHFAGTAAVLRARWPVVQLSPGVLGAQVVGGEWPLRHEEALKDKE